MDISKFDHLCQHCIVPNECEITHPKCFIPLECLSRRQKLARIKRVKKYLQEVKAGIKGTRTGYFLNYYAANKERISERNRKKREAKNAETNGSTEAA